MVTFAQLLRTKMLSLIRSRMAHQDAPPEALYDKQEERCVTPTLPRHEQTTSESQNHAFASPSEIPQVKFCRS